MQPQSPNTLIPASSDLCRALHIHGFSLSLGVLQVILQQNSHMFSPKPLKYFSHFVPTYLSLHINYFTSSPNLLASSDFSIADFQRAIHSGACPHMQVLVQLSDLSVFLSGMGIPCRQESHPFSLPFYSLPYQPYTLHK